MAQSNNRSQIGFPSSSPDLPNHTVVSHGSSPGRSGQSQVSAAGSSAQTSTQDDWVDQRASDQASRAALARGKSGRRRGVDPTTCDPEYSKAELEFMMAMDHYKKRSGRNFPTWCEVLEVLQSLGYEKAPHEVAQADAAAISPLPGTEFPIDTTMIGSETR